MQVTHYAHMQLYQCTSIPYVYIVQRARLALSQGPVSLNLETDCNTHTETLINSLHRSQGCVLITKALEGNLHQLLTCIGRRSKRVREGALSLSLAALSLSLCAGMFGGNTRKLESKGFCWLVCLYPGEKRALGQTRE